RVLPPGPAPARPEPRRLDLRPAGGAGHPAERGRVQVRLRHRPRRPPGRLAPGPRPARPAPLPPLLCGARPALATQPGGGVPPGPARPWRRVPPGAGPAPQPPLGPVRGNRAERPRGPCPADLPPHSLRLPAMNTDRRRHRGILLGVAACAAPPSPDRTS